MYTLITIFYISLIGMTLMLVLKRREAVSGNPTITSKIGSGSDPIFQSVFRSVRRAVSYVNKHTFIALGHLIAFYVLSNIRKVYVELKHRFITTPHGKRLIDAVRGKGEVKADGASFFLRRIAAKENKR